jgi:hypothetical protein
MATLESNNSNNSIESNNAKMVLKPSDSLTALYEEIYESHLLKYNERNKNTNKKAKVIPLQKIDTEKMVIPLFQDHTMLLKYNYTLQQLKMIIAHHKLKLKLNGTKSSLVTNIYSFLYLSARVIEIQKIFRGFLVKKYILSQGPALRKRGLCTNVTDFLTMDNISDLTYEQFFSFQDIDGFIYGFDLLSIYNLIYKFEGPIKNPYNRLPITKEIIENFGNLIRLSKILKINICTELENVNEGLTFKKSIELRALTLFQNIDALGNYSNPKWLLELTKVQIVRFIKELFDIWAYRAPISLETKRNICHPTGNPFQRMDNFNQLLLVENIDDVRKIILEILEKFVNTGIDKDSKCLGTYYVLGALTIVNPIAAESLPWLYQAFSYM